MDHVASGKHYYNNHNSGHFYSAVSHRHIGYTHAHGRVRAHRRNAPGGGGGGVKQKDDRILNVWVGELNRKTTEF